MQSFSKSTKLLYCFFISLLIELCSNTLLINEWRDLNPVIWFIFSILSTYLGYKLINSKVEINLSNLQFKIFVLLTLGLNIAIFFICKDYFKFSIDSHWSDVVPATELYVKRFLNGHDPYAPMPIAEWIVNPNYPPLRWLPFCFSEIFKIDYRWTSVFFINCFFGYFYFKSKNIIAVFFAALYLLVYVIDQKGEFFLTSELIVGFYYLLFAWAIFRNNYYLIAFSIIACIFSRFYIIYTLPLIAFYFFTRLETNKFFKFGIITIIIGLIFYLPFFNELNAEYFNVNKNFTQRSIDAWQLTEKYTNSDLPKFIHQGLSFSSYFNFLLSTSIPAKIKFQNTCQIISCIMLIFYSIYYYFKNREFINNELYIILILKITLVLIFSFNTCPYPYLYVFPFLLNVFFIPKIKKQLFSH